MAITNTGRVKVVVSGARGPGLNTEDAAQLNQIKQDTQAAASQASAAAAAVVPLGTAFVARNDAEETVYGIDLPARIGPLSTGQKFQFVVPETAVGAVIWLAVKATESDDRDVRTVFFVNGRQLRQGWLVTFSANNGGVRWNFETQVPNDAAMVDAERNARAAYAVDGAFVGVQIARLVADNPNDLLIANAPLVDSALFQAYIPYDITGPFWISNIDGDRRAAVNRVGGTPYTDGVAGGTIASFEYSGGFGQFVYRNDLDETVPTIREIEALATAASPDIWSVFASAVSEPYGTVTKGADNKPVFTPRTIHILGRGSSVSTSAADTARKGGCPPGHVPVNLLRDGINRKFGPGISAVAWNGSFGGETADRSHKQWTEMRDAGMPIPEIAADCWGMNDSTPSAYNSGQVSPTFIPNGYYNDVKDKLDLGVKLFIIFTTPDEHTGRASYRLASSVPMYWPYAVSAPVAPDQLVPPATSTVENGGSVVTRDWTGRGIKTDGGARTAHVNDMLRDVVRRFNADPKYRGRVILGDAGWAWHRYGVEEYSLDQLYDPQEFAHPNVLGHQVSYDRVIREIVDAMQRSTGDKWWFRGEGVDTSAE